MFNFRVLPTADGQTKAWLSDDEVDCDITFLTNDRRTSVICSIAVGDEHKRLSVARYSHNEKHIGAFASNSLIFAE